MSFPEALPALFLGAAVCVMVPWVPADVVMFHGIVLEICGVCDALEIFGVIEVIEICGVCVVMDNHGFTGHGFASETNGPYF